MKYNFIRITCPICGNSEVFDENILNFNIRKHKYYCSKCDIEIVIKENMYEKEIITNKERRKIEREFRKGYIKFLYEIYKKEFKSEIEINSDIAIKLVGNLFEKTINKMEK